MGKYIIRGGKRISGEYRVGGAKNAALPILAATVLTGGVSVIHDCPRISDTFNSIEILKTIGCKAVFDGGTVTVDSSCAHNCEIPDSLSGLMRSSVIFLGSLVGRFGKAGVCYPGGCETEGPFLPKCKMKNFEP